jgi:hypothetical protein
MFIQNLFPPTAEILEEGIVVGVASLESDGYEGQIPDRLEQAVREGRVRAESEIDYESVIGEDGEVIAYKVSSARYHLIEDGV